MCNNYLVLRDSISSILFSALFCTFSALLLLVISVVGSSIVKEYEDIVVEIIVFLVIFGIIWLISCFAMLFSKTVVVTTTEIKMFRGKKIKWCIKKEEVIELIYNRVSWYYCFLPLLPSNAFKLEFRLSTSKKISSEACSLSLRQIMKIENKLNFPITIKKIYKNK